MAENKYHFERLTPTDSLDLNVYEEAINYVFDNPDVRNVAISGAYSAGKSSVLASYKKKHSIVVQLSRQKSKLFIMN
jgi:DNA replication protein DnaC